MENTIKELIESATVNGTISEEERNYIIKKASEMGIDEIEVNIFIKATLQKNSIKLNPNDTNTTNKNFTENNWLKFNEFKLGNWIIIIGIILIFISGFLPWATSRVSSSGYGQSYGASGSIGGGFFYTLPLAIAAFLFAMKRNLNHLRIYFGPFVMVVAIGLAAAYTNSVKSSGGGFSGSASSSAGPGVALLFISGLIYLIGCIVLPNNSKIRKVLIHEYAILAYFLFLIIIPISFYDFYFEFWPSIFASIFWAGLPLLLANYKGYLKTKSVLIGNLAFWLLIIILPLYPESSILQYARETFDSISFYYLYLFTTICLAALISDFLQSKGKNIEIIKNLKVLFKPKVLVLAIIIPFICLTLFSTITKHEVEDDSRDALVIAEQVAEEVEDEYEELQVEANEKVVEEEMEEAAPAETEGANESAPVTEEYSELFTSYYVDDPDGWVNLRNRPNGEIIKRVDNYEVGVKVGKEGDWILLRFDDGSEGFIHITRLKEAP